MKSKILNPSLLSSQNKLDMLILMEKYYEGFSKEQFFQDLKTKQLIILLLKETGKLAGFSTIEIAENREPNGSKSLHLFSGDTVLEKEFWGNGALASAFGKVLVLTKLRNPFKEVYWFLMSKGYKTYLIMANNFQIHYPRPDQPTPESIQAKLDSYYSNKFPDRYSKERGIITSVDNSGHLKISVADIDLQLLKNPKIHFFSLKNPKWQSGDELACIAIVTLWVPIRYAFKRILKWIK
ncbi:MAG: hypothetical protein J0M15_05475 [Deltaproteobacteria bacterium]|jgi:hypothetical protein|nr:hypothetical protein [Deltaproteobacteria bacterium]